MDKNRRTQLPPACNALIRPEPGVESDRHDPKLPAARHVVRVAVNETTSSIGYRYNDDFEVGVNISTNFLIGLFK